MGWKYDWMQWRYYHCKDEQVNKYRGLLQQELGRAFAGRESSRVNHRKREIPIIVSLTSIPERLPYVQYPIRCMLRQTIKPDKIVLYLNKEKLSDDKIPAELLQLKENGLEIVYVEDIGPHTKYFYALQTYGDCYVITVDDDILYGRTLIRDLLRTESQYRGAVCARRARAFRFTQQGIPYPYSSYSELTGRQPQEGNYLLALGVGGVLYPPGCMDPAEFELDNMRRLSYYTDDLWLKAMELLRGIKVVRAGGRGHRDIFIQRTQEVALCKKNHAHGNDDNIKALFTQYDLFRFFAGSDWKVDAGKDAIVRRILMEWLSLYQKGLSIGDFLIKRGVRSAAIYGMARLGILLQFELEERGVEVCYGIDARGVNNVALPVVRPEDIPEPVDLIIVTAVTDFLELKSRLENYTDSRVEMLENIIAELLFENT